MGVELKKKIILVTGAAGFIGSNLVKHLNDKGYKDIVIVDDMTDGSKFRNMKNLKYLSYVDKENFYSQIMYQIPRLDYIFHLGAISSTSHQNGKELIDSSYTSLVKLSNHFRCPIQYSSSASVYGNKKNGEIDPLNCYAFSKKMCDDFNSVLKTNLCGLRYFNVYGMNEFHKFKNNQCSPVLSFFHQAITDKCIKVFDIESKRDFVHVDDVCKFHVWLMENEIIEKGLAPTTIDVGTGTSTSFMEIAKMVFSCLALDLGPKLKIETIEAPPHVDLRAYQFNTSAQPHMAQLGYSERLLTPKEGLLQYVAELKDSYGLNKKESREK